MAFLFLALLGFSIAADWTAVNKNNQKIIYLAKPSVMIVLIVASLYYAWPVGTNMGFFIAGLIFSLIGDVLLMLPTNRFIFGLLAFLAAHISYILALDLFPIHSDDFIPTAIMVVLLTLVSIQAIRQLSKGIKVMGKQKYLIPVALYISSLAIFSLAAISHFYKLGTPAVVSYLLSAGAILFIFSDLQLAWNRFIEQKPKDRLKIHISYHLAQILLTAGILIKYS